MLKSSLFTSGFDWVPNSIGHYVFLTLNFNNAVLYAPSDFNDDKGFLASNNKSLVSEVHVKSTQVEQGFRFSDE